MEQGSISACFLIIVSMIAEDRYSTGAPGPYFQILDESWVSFICYFIHVYIDCSLLQC